MRWNGAPRFKEAEAGDTRDPRLIQRGTLANPSGSFEYRLSALLTKCYCCAQIPPRLLLTVVSLRLMLAADASRACFGDMLIGNLKYSKCVNSPMTKAVDYGLPPLTFTRAIVLAIRITPRQLFLVLPSPFMIVNRRI